MFQKKKNDRVKARGNISRIEGKSRVTSPEMFSRRASDASHPGDGDSSLNNVAVVQYPGSIVSEQFRMLRTRLSRLHKQKRIQTIMISSSLPGEGKSFVATNLAVTIAHGFDSQVLLLDADLRKPSLHHYFKINPGEGLSDIIIRGRELDDVAVKTGIGGLSVVCAGTCPESPAEILSSKKMASFIDIIRSRYRENIIIFDTTPVELTSEPLALADMVDGIILVVKAGMTKKRMVKNTIKLLGKKKILGIVLNYCQMTQKPYYGGYGTYTPKKT